jgi:hypothetical protein
VATWRVARSLDALLAQLNALAPRRSKASDGSIGDAAHATRDSDHNPHYILNGQPLVTARDFTHDPAGGLDGQWLADTLVRSRDSRIKYIIWNRRIVDSRAGNHPWQWMPYSGINPHEHHVHVSVMANPSCDDPRRWDLGGGGGSAPPSSGHATIQRGSTGPDVELLQRFLGVVGLGDPGYGTFGPATLAAVIRYQKMQGLVADGIVGNATWAKIGL